jgi:uncharacterized protein
MKTGRWHTDRVFWAVLAGGVALVGLWRIAFGAGEAPGLATMLLLILVYPLLEEAVFRGIIQPALHEWTRGAGLAGLSLANIITSVLFAAVHMPAHGILHAALVFGPSLVFGLFRERHGTVASPAVLHVTWNAASVLLLGLKVSPV